MTKSSKRCASVFLVLCLGFFCLGCTQGESCTPDCFDRKCGHATNGCNGSNACGVCSDNERCDAEGKCESLACDSGCGDRKCGLTPATCDSPASNCGTCALGTLCTTSTGACDPAPTHEKAGDFCKCETNSCSIPCGNLPEEANTCLITNHQTGEGFCSYGCLSPGSNECSGDFPDGCCALANNRTFCLRSGLDFCSAIQASKGYLETCGQNGESCQENLVCVGGWNQDPNAYCLLTCDPPDGVCQDQGECIELYGGRGACLPSGNRTFYEFCELPTHACLPGLTCLSFYGAETSGKGICTPLCDCELKTGCNESSVCDLPILGEENECGCAIHCPSRDKAECPNHGVGFQCKAFGIGDSVESVCVPE
jgi:hypothetical protein